VSGMDHALDAALRDDVRAWVRGFLAQRARLESERVGLSVERVFDRDRRVLIGLTGTLLAGIVAIPLLGPLGVVGGLVAVYVGTAISAVATLSRVRALRRGARTAVDPAEVERIADACPPLGVRERNLLIRLMNVSRAAPTPRGRAMLAALLAEAVVSPTLGAWPFLHGVAAVVRGPDGERLGPFVEDAAPRDPSAAHGCAPAGHPANPT
jgi:hypothetical protein